MISSNTVEEALALYREAAIRAAGASTSNPEESNRWADTGIACYRQLSATPEGKAGIIALMSDENVYVRCLAAAHSLQWMPEAARTTLEVLRDADGPGSFEAKWTLIEYDSGTLSFD